MQVDATLAMKLKISKIDTDGCLIHQSTKIPVVFCSEIFLEVGILHNRMKQVQFKQGKTFMCFKLNATRRAFLRFFSLEQNSLCCHYYTSFVTCLGHLHRYVTVQVTDIVLISFVCNYYPNFFFLSSTSKNNFCSLYKLCEGKFFS